MIYIAAIIIITVLLAVSVFLYLNIKSVKTIIRTIELGNGKFSHEFKDRFEIFNASSKYDFKFVVYEKGAFSNFRNLIDTSENKLVSMVEKTGIEVNSACKAIKVDVKSWEIESVTIHDLNGNCTVFVDLPLNPEIKWGIEIDINLNTLEIEQIEFCH